MNILEYVLSPEELYMKGPGPKHGPFQFPGIAQRYITTKYKLLQKPWSTFNTQ